MNHRRARLAVPLLVAVAALFLAACGSGGGNAAGVATLGNQSSSGDSKAKNDKAPTEEETKEAFRQYAQCMREHGVDMQDPGADGGGPQVVQPKGGDSGPQSAVSVGGATVMGLSPDDPAFKDADSACRHFIEGVIANAQKNIDPKELEKLKQQALDFAKCMREHGIDMPDPQFGENGAMTQKVQIDQRDSQQFQQAQEACKQYVPDGVITQAGPGGRVEAGAK